MRWSVYPEHRKYYGNAMNADNQTDAFPSHSHATYILYVVVEDFQMA
ncbi:hypothetical protein OTSANNIE_1099 [Anaplasma phagocytophilum str. Annie]|nr:hypothetical protein APHWEB_1187 [Anaplasma phagocytophilum str. Webster]KJV98807.1 hypothetical protein OTSANNIE_1099 [Anaplasma phagocytophilum str. Annie]